MDRRIIERFRRFNTFWDRRFEDLTPETWLTTLYRDFSAGLIVALTAIPMAMGFAMAMGLRPEQGIIAGALACLVGRTWGGSKYQVYGPTAAFIPVIAALISKYGNNGENLAEAHGFLVFVSLLAGIVLMIMGLFGMGKYAKLVPNSIVVGFTVGIAVAIVLSNIGEALGIKTAIRGEFFEKMKLLWEHLGEFNGYAFGLALLTFLMARYLLRISIYIPAPLLALGLCTFLAATVFSDRDISLVRDKYGTIPTNFIIFTPPQIPPLSTEVLVDILYFVVAIVFVSGVESLLCSSMADRLADNRKTPFDPDKEFWGQGLVQIITPMVNGFPCTGALARTATSIKAGAVTPFAGYFKGVLKILMAIFLAPWLEQVPMACIGGILLWVATNMVKPKEIREVWNHSRFHAFLMVFTAVMVPITDFLVGVLSALTLYGLLYRVCDHGTSAASVSKATSFPPPPLPFETVTVGLTLTPHDDHLLSYAALLQRHNIVSRFQFVHITEDARQDREALQRQLRQAVQIAWGEDAADRRLRFDVLAGERTEEMLRYTHTNPADLILLGHRRHRRGQRSLSTRMAMLTPGCVWMIPEGSAHTIRKVITPVDLTGASASSLTVATGIASRVGLTECLALHVHFDPSRLEPEPRAPEPLQDERTALRQFLQPLQSPAVAITPILEVSSQIAATILRSAQEQQCDLIVLHSRGRTTAAQLFLGTQAQQILTDSPVPVLVVKQPGAPINLLQALSTRELWSQPSPQAS